MSETDFSEDQVEAVARVFFDHESWVSRWDELEADHPDRTEGLEVARRALEAFSRAAGRGAGGPSHGA